MARRKKNRMGAIVGAAANMLNTVGYILLVLGIALIISTAAIIVANDVLALVKEDNEVQLTFESEQTASEVSRALSENGIVNYGFLFRMYASVKKVKSFDGGIYTLNSSMDYGQIMSTLTRENVQTRVVKVTIPEGYTMRDIAALMEENQVCSQKVFLETAAEYDFSHGFLKDVPEGENRLEGYLFPDTYEFYVNEKPASVINKMLNNFDRRFTEGMRKLTEQSGRSIAEIVNVASLVEKEAMWASERTIIAGVIYNRINDPARFPCLQIDATLMYITGHKEALTAQDITLNSPYNTYTSEGLPPTAICNPGVNAMLAAISPEENGYFYYVADPATGGHLFSKTLSEHNRNIAAIKSKTK